MKYLHYEEYKNKRKKWPIILIIFFVIILAVGGILLFRQLNAHNMAPQAEQKQAVKSAEKEPEKEPKDPGRYELPVEGATGFASVSMSLKEDKSENSSTVRSLDAGQAFMIEKEKDDWWKIKVGYNEGWVRNKFCMINLPDIIPSVIYDDTNSYSSVFRSSGKELPGVTGEKLYDAITYNGRLKEDMPLMPVLYMMADKIYKAQKSALENDNSLLIYESYRPYSVQRKVVDSLTSLMDSDSEVRNGINNGSWSKSWFISTGKSHHQLGGAIDVSLAKVNVKEDVWTGEYKYTKIIEYEEYDMPTKIHELSTDAVAFSSPVNNKNGGWKNASPSSKMNDAAMTLQTYCTGAGLSPLASEWWHFDDWDALDATSGNKSSGNFEVKECFSTVI